MVAGLVRPPVPLAEALSGALEPVLDGAIRIDALRRLTGGTSHDSWAFDAFVGHVREPLPLVLRRNFSDRSLDLPTATEFELLRRLHAAGVAVPRPVAGGGDASTVGASFIVSERWELGDLRKRIAAGTVDLQGLGRALVNLQARIHRLDWAQVLGTLLPHQGPDTAAQLVAHWCGVAQRLSPAADPLLAAAIDWLRANVPTGAPLALLHGDFKTNNLVMREASGVGAVDWELAHIGDPLEDLAWTLLWTTPHDLVGGLLAPDEYLAAYAEATGSAVDPARLAFWRLFVLVKLVAIFLRSPQLLAGTQHPSPTHLLLLRSIPWLQRQMARLLLQTLEAGACR